MSSSCANVISLLHLGLVLWMIYTPLLDPSPHHVILHVIVSLFLLGHWAVGNTTCALTLIEKRVRGVQDDKSFVHSVVSPVYDIPDPKLRVIVRWCTIGLLTISLLRLYASGWGPMTEFTADIRRTAESWKKLLMDPRA